MKNKNGQSAAKQVTWKPIKNWEDLYEVSEDGQVYSIRRGKCLKPRMSLDGYKRVCLFKDGKGYEYRVARLVAEAFVENPENKSQVNHKDYNRMNDIFTNLEWCSNYENAHYSYDAGKYMIPENFKVYTFTNVYNGKTFSIIGISNVAKQFGCSKKNFKALITSYANTGKYVKQGLFKGLRIDSEYLKVQRLESDLVASSEAKCGTSLQEEDIV